MPIEETAPETGADVGGEIGGGAGGVGSESFASAMSRIAGGEDWDSGEPATEDTESDGDQPPALVRAAEKAAGKPPKSAEPTVEELKALAEKLGYKFDDSSVSPAERAAFREVRRKKEEEWKREEESLRARLRGEEDQHKSKLDRIAQFEKAEDSGDLDGMAKALGHENWEKLQETALARITDPHYKELQDLKKWRQQEEERKKVEAEERKKQEETQSRQQAERNYMQSLSTEMKSAGGLFEALHDDAGFVSQVMQIQRMHWDPELEQSISFEQAVDWKNPQTGRSLRQSLEGLRDKLNRAFGDTPAETQANSGTPKPTPKPRAPKTGVVSAAERSGATSRGPWKKEDDDEFFAHARARLSEAAFEDEKARRG